MKRLFSVLAVAALSTGGAHAQGPTCDRSEPSCVLEAAWGAALVLPKEKVERLAPAFLEIADLSEDPALIAFWESRLDQSVSATKHHPDYGWQKAEPIVQTSGIDGLIDTAKRRAEPLNFGRADALLSAGRQVLTADPAGAERLNDALLTLAQSASEFERPVLAHAAAELAMVRCDPGLFAKATALTTAPNNLRYAFWRARMQGGARPLLARVRAIDTDEDTREVRRVLEGYRAILELGYCSIEGL